MKTMQQKKESKKVLAKKGKLNLPLSICNYLKLGIRPSKIYHILGIKRERMQHHLSSMKKEGVIKKIGYGVWEVDEKKEGQIRSPCDSQRRANSVRSHGFVFILDNPKNNIYEKNKHYSKYENIKSVSGIGKRLIIHGTKIHLWPKHTMFYLNKSFYNNHAIEGSANALQSLISTIRQLESSFGISLKTRGSYRFRLTRQHHALINNEIAIDCNQKKEKVRIYAEDGKLCMLIDNSLNLNELETCHPVDAVKDNNAMKVFLEAARRNPNILDILTGSALQQAKTMEEATLAIHNLALGLESIMTLFKGLQLKEEEEKEEEVKERPYYVG